MKQTLEKLLLQSVHSLQTQGDLPKELTFEVRIDRTKDKTHGDYATNLAMMLAKPCKMAPAKLAERIIAALPPHAGVKEVQIAGAGFINFFIQEDALAKVIAQVLSQGDSYGHSEIGRGHKVLLEFVSANPTGPLHVGHGRSAAYGATLANLLKVAGYKVHSEYYVNDAGRQMNILAASVWLRYLQLGKEPIVFPANGYKGDYVNEIAQGLMTEQGRKWMCAWSDVVTGLPADEPEGGDKELYIDAMITRARDLLGEEGFSLFHQYALNSVLDDIKDDLHQFGVNYDQWFSENSLLADGSLNKGIAALKQTGHCYEQDGALWFRSTAFGDEKDRVLVRANGISTYFASDVAYHWNKYDRGYDKVVDIFGADHHGYFARVKAAMQALGHDEEALKVLYVQFAILYRGNERVQMSTRSGSFVTLRELRDEVGNDAARFFYSSRKPEQHMDFDLDLAKSQSNDNPVYYIQYAHARICSVLRQLKERGLSFSEEQGLQQLELLKEPQENVLISLLSRYPEMIEHAAVNCEPHQITHYLKELAAGLHSYYNAVVLLCENQALREARLCLLKAVRQVLFNGLMVLGVSAPEIM